VPPASVVAASEARDSLVVHSIRKPREGGSH